MIGRVISHYRILDKIGQGGMGVVYKARDLTLGRFVALKFLHPHIAGQKTESLRFEREAKAAASLNHPNICAIYEFVRDKEHTFIAMEYINGVTLKQHIKQQGKLPVALIVEYIKTIAGVLSIAHQNGVIHRDIKSDNIMLTPDGELKVMDFGLAKMLDAPTITVSEHPMGTVSYMSPEMVKAQKVDHRTDLWSLGVVFYEMLTGDMPFQSDTEVSTIYAILNHKPGSFTDHQVNVDKSVQYIITTLLEKDVRHRYQTAENLVYDLEHKVRASSTKLLFRKVRKNARVLSVLFLLLFVLLFVFVRFIQPQINKPPWLKSGAVPMQLTSDTGIERGTMSPDGENIAYIINQNTLYIKNLRSKQIKEVYKPTDGIIRMPQWMPLGDKISFVSLYANRVSTLDLKTNKLTDIVTVNDGNINLHNWSYDEKKLLYYDYTQVEGEFIGSLNIINYDGRYNKKLLETRYPVNYITRAAWHPNGHIIAYLEYLKNSEKHVIRFIDVNTGEITGSNINVKFQEHSMWRGGLTYSPDGKYLVYPELVNGNAELVAMPMNKSGTAARGDFIPVTRLSGMGAPFWHNFAIQKNILCYNVLIENWDIHSLPLDLKNKRIIDRPTRLTINKEYDYDPSWSPDGQKIVFVSNREGQRDIFIRELAGENELRITNDKQVESKTRFLPDEPSISFLADNKVWKIPASGGVKRLIFPQQDDSTRVFQYAWGKDSTVLYATITESNSFNSAWHTIQVELPVGQKTKLFSFINVLEVTNIQYNPARNALALRSHSADSVYMQVIQIYDLNNRTCKNLLYHSAIVPNGEISWTPDGNGILYSSWLDERTFAILLKEINDKPPVILKEITTTHYNSGQLSPDGTKVLVYTSIWDSDIWMLGQTIVDN